MTQPSPAHIERAMSAAMQLKSTLNGEDADEQLIADMIEGETDVFELLDRILEDSVADRLMSEMAYARGKRFKDRSDKMRELARQMMEALGLDKLERATYTASLATGTPPVEVTGVLPVAFMRPDTVLVRKALLKGEQVDNAHLGEAPVVLKVLTR